MHKTKLKLPSSSLCRDQMAQTMCCSDDTDHNHDIYLQFHSFQMLKPALDDRFICLHFFGTEFGAFQYAHFYTLQVSHMVLTCTHENSGWL